MAWIPHVKGHATSILPSCIVVQLCNMWINTSLKVINVYVPYSNCFPFWE
jgi:hypothetical protein